MDITIRSDLYRYGGLSGFKGFVRGLLIPGFRYTFLIRQVAKHKDHPIRRIFYSLLKRRYMYKYGFQIEPETKIGKGLYLGHFGTVVVNTGSTIGENCSISPGVLIGFAPRGWIKGCPTIGDRVWIGANSAIIGKVTIGSNVLIAPNSTVNVDVPDNSMVRGNPAKIVPADDATEGFYTYILKE